MKMKVGAPTDRLGNPLAHGLPYARGEILPDTAADWRKLERAWRIMERRVRDKGPEAVYNFSGLVRSLNVPSEDLPHLDDELAPALYQDELCGLGLEHLGGTAERHDIALVNRVTAATIATQLALVKQGDVVIGVSPSYSHPSVPRIAERLGARFVDTVGADEFARAFAREDKVALVVLTRLAVTYDILPAQALRTVIDRAHDRGVLVYLDDAGGARIGPAIFDQPKTLETGADIGATGLDKYGTTGPRMALVGGLKDLVARVRASAYEFALEARPMLYPAAVRSLKAYTPERIRALVGATKDVAAALRPFTGNHLHETPVTAQLFAEDILEIAMERQGLRNSKVVPYEASAGLAMLLLEDYGAFSIHFAGLPLGTSSLLLKFVPPDTLQRFGGARALAGAVDQSLSKLGRLIQDPAALRSFLLEG